MKKNKRLSNFIFLVLFTLINIVVFAKADAKLIETRIDIYNKTDYANTLIEHFNQNIIYLSKYQEELNFWYKDPLRKIEDLPKLEELPKYSFAKLNGIKFNVEYEYTFSNDVFNYNYHLNRMARQVSLFNVKCFKIEQLEFQNLDSFRIEINSILENIQIQSLEMGEIAYDFSRSCAVNFKTDKHPEQLLMLRNLIVQSKGIIMGLRNFNSSQTQDYFDQLDEFFINYKKDKNITELLNESNTTLSPAKLKIATDHIYKKSILISSRGAEFLNYNSYTFKVMNDLLQLAITDFNITDNNLGCANAFNSILVRDNPQYLFVVEEPNVLYADLIDKPEKIVYVKERVKFDVADENSLDGALPNNLIILFDVTASMKKSGALPIVKNSIKHILNIMRDEDRLSLIAYSGQAKVLISAADNTDYSEIADILLNLKSSGGSDLKNALDSAYLIGANNFKSRGNNKIIIASDGVFGISPAISKLVKNQTLNGFSLSVFQYNIDDKKINSKSLNELAEIGNGSFRTIKSEKDAISVLMEEIKKEFVDE